MIEAALNIQILHQNLRIIEIFNESQFTYFLVVAFIGHLPQQLNPNQFRRVFWGISKIKRLNCLLSQNRIKYIDSSGRIQQTFRLWGMIELNTFEETQQIQLFQMNKQELSVQVVDRRLQVNLDEQEGSHLDNSKNQFMNSQGFEAKQPNEYQEQEEDEEPQYKLSKLIPKQNQKERLIEQNIRLKTQIYQLAKQLDQILLKDKSKKKSYGIGLPKIEEEDELVRQKKLQIQKQQIEIQQLKSKIFIAKRQLECVYNHEAIQAKEDEIKVLKGKLKILEDEKDGHLNIQKVQSKALKVVRNEEEYGEKLKNVMNQANQLRKQSKQLLQKIAVAQKVLYKTHDTYVGKHQKIKELQQKLALNKEKGKNKKPSESMITDDMIQGLQQEIKKLQADRRQGQKTWQQKIKAIDIQLMLKRTEEEKKLLIIREKQKQLKINQIKIKQLRKLARQIEDGPSEAKKTQDMDMSQFRHKRNIRYLQK